MRSENFASALGDLFLAAVAGEREWGRRGAGAGITHGQHEATLLLLLLLWFIKQKRKRFPIETTFRVQVFKNSSFTRVQHESCPASKRERQKEKEGERKCVCASNKKMYCRKSIKMHFVYAFYGLKISFTASWVHVCVSFIYLYVCVCECVWVCHLIAVKVDIIYAYCICAELITWKEFSLPGIKLSFGNIYAKLNIKFKKYTNF